MNRIVTDINNEAIQANELTQLLKRKLNRTQVTQFINEDLKQSSSIGSVTLDIEKPFDSVWNGGLLNKLNIVWSIG